MPKTSLKWQFSSLLNLPPEVACLFLVSPCFLCKGTSFRFYAGNSQVFEPTVGEPARRPENGVLGKRHQEGNPALAHDLYVGKGGVYVRGMWTAT